MAENIPIRVNISLTHFPLRYVCGRYHCISLHAFTLTGFFAELVPKEQPLMSAGIAETPSKVCSELIVCRVLETITPDYLPVLADNFHNNKVYTMLLKIK